MSAVLIYALLWISFGAGHSLLTLANIKSKLEPVMGGAYRLAYNLFALLHITLVLIFGRGLLSTDRFEFLSLSPLVVISYLLVIGGGILILFAVRQYDLGQFSGLSQLRAGRSSSKVALEPLCISGLNRWVRHPIYTGAFIFLWGGAVSPYGFWTALFASAYLIIGAHYEERKLITVYGDAYLDYKRRVPAFFSFRAPV